MRTGGDSVRKLIVNSLKKNANQRNEGIFYMNLPNINPQLRKTEKGKVMDWVFVIRETEVGPNIEKVVDVECYIDEEWHRGKTMKGVNIEDARKTWNLLVTKGFERCTHL